MSWAATGPASNRTNDRTTAKRMCLMADSFLRAAHALEPRYVTCFFPLLNADGSETRPLYQSPYALG